jgi:hypothetical protein
MQKGEFCTWLDAVPGLVHRAKCKLCIKTFDIGIMGLSALKCHMQSKRHCDLLQQSLDNNPATGNQLTLDGSLDFSSFDPQQPTV